MPTRNVELTDHLDNLIRDSIETGRYRDASEVVGEGLGLLEQREAEDRARLESLRIAASEGFACLDRGEGMVFDSPDDLAEFVDHAGEALITQHLRG